MDKITFLKNAVLEYSWGSKTFIPEILGRPSPAKRPQAELWMGAHPKSPSQALYEGEWKPLSELIQKKPEAILGKSVTKRFSNKLPFLFKILAAAKPLSVQAHPNREDARKGFARENRLKIPLSAPSRNYRDDNHKPEMICALSPFWALSGFRKVDDLIGLMDMLRAPALGDSLRILRAQPDSKGLKAFLTRLLSMERESQKSMVTEVVKRCEKNATADPAFEWTARLNQEYSGDVGPLFPIMMNLVRLQPAEALYNPAGRLHAYLEGAGIELMANSDNVLRGALTAKHTDVPELLNILDFSCGDVDILKPKQQGNGESIYPILAEEFLLSVISPGKGMGFESAVKRTVEVMICTQGRARVTDLGSGDLLAFKQGTAVIVPAAVEQYRIEGDATVYKASVPF